MATNARQIHHALHPCPLMDQSIFEAYCDDCVPHYLSVPNEQAHSKDIEVRVRGGILEVKVVLLPVVIKMKKVKVD